MREIDELKIENSQLKIQVESILSENENLKNNLLNNEALVQRAKENIELLNKTNLLISRKEKNLQIEKEITEIKGEEFSSTIEFNRYNNKEFSFDEENLEVLLGTKVLIKVYDDRFFIYLKKVLEIFSFIFDHYLRSSIAMNAKHILDRQKDINDGG
jgi:hypothetical protein